MSVSVYWQPVKGRLLTGHNTLFSAFVEDMKKLFGPFPLTLGTENVETLKGLAMKHDVCKELVERIYEYETIELRLDY